MYLIKLAIRAPHQTGVRERGAKIGGHGIEGLMARHGIAGFLHRGTGLRVIHRPGSCQSPTGEREHAEREGAGNPDSSHLKIQW